MCETCQKKLEILFDQDRKQLQWIDIDSVVVSVKEDVVIRDLICVEVKFDFRKVNSFEKEKKFGKI